MPAIVPSLTHIYNASIITGNFPTKFKQAKLCPIYKKGSVHERNNYRPISVLPIISKPLERHVATSYLKYLDTYGLLYRYQSAYRPHHSCETALINLTDNWLKAMDESNLVGVILVKRLTSSITISCYLKYQFIKPVPCMSIIWFKSYLSERSQVCSVSGSLSAPLTVSCGVPQGSILGPVLFSLFINDLPLNVPEANIDVYADDTTLWKSGDKCIKIPSDLQSSLNCANVWFEQNHMKPNIKKTKHLLIGTHQKLRHASISSLKRNSVEEAVNEKLLGIKLERNLSLNDHVDYLMKKLNLRFFLLKRAKGFVYF